MPETAQIPASSPRIRNRIRRRVRGAGEEFARSVILLTLLAWASHFPRATWAAEVPAGGPGAPAGAPKADKANQPEEEDFSATPFTEYGEFNQIPDEEAETKFFQHGRFFGVSLGLGYQGVTGNRGILWKGGFPDLDFRVVAWLDFNFALQLGVSWVPHYLDSEATGEHRDLDVTHLGVNLKYYFDAKNLSSAITFANPNIQLGTGAYSLSQVRSSDGQPARETKFGLNFGAGLEFAVSPRKVYFGFDARYHIVSYSDTFTQDHAPQVPDLTGGYYTFVGTVLFTW